MKPLNTADIRLAEQAADWVLRLEGDNSLETHDDFNKWLRLSARHVHEFLMVKAAYVELSGSDPHRTIDLSTLDPNSTERNVVSLMAREDKGPDLPLVSHARILVRSSRVRPRWRGWRLAAAALGVVALAGLLLQSTARGTYTTSVGNQNAIKLSDGSVMHLNVKSRAEVHFSRTAREIRLIEGEALFVVEHDVARPFRVLTSDTTIEAVGTQFNVHRQSNAVRVSVVEGSVKIFPEASVDTTAERSSPTIAPELERVARLAAGEEADVSGGNVVKVPMPDVDRALAWRARRLVFDGEPLESVVAEFNRYNRVQIRVDRSSSLHQLSMSGVFDADDAEPLIRFLSEDPAVEIEKKPDEIVIRVRQAPH